MDLEYRFRVTYASGAIKIRESRSQATLNREETLRVVRSISENGNMNGQDIADIINRLRETVLELDVLYDQQGRLRNAPLKKPRDITSVDVWIPTDEIERIRKYPIEVYEAPAEKMKLYRSDGSFITIESNQGIVTVVDSRKEGIKHLQDADTFIRSITL